MFNRALRQEIARLSELADDRKNQLLEKSVEISYLRESLQVARKHNADLLDRFMSLNERAFQVFKAEKRMEEPPPAPTFVDPMGRIASMDATTAEEREQKEEAMTQIRSILGH